MWTETCGLLVGFLVDFTISIHSARVDGDEDAEQNGRVLTISIHSARVDGDPGCPRSGFYHVVISIHSARVDGDIVRTFSCVTSSHFLSLIHI